jgi:hypothetical protein
MTRAEFDSILKEHRNFRQSLVSGAPRNSGYLIHLHEHLSEKVVGAKANGGVGTTDYR